MQVKFGDAQGNNPVSIFEPINRLKWDAWARYRGWDRERALSEFLWRAEENFRFNGRSLEDPNKASIEARYDKCIADQLA